MPYFRYASPIRTTLSEPCPVYHDMNPEYFLILCPPLLKTPCLLCLSFAFQVQERRAMMVMMMMIVNDDIVIDAASS